jgi:hypothetical protein
MAAEDQRIRTPPTDPTEFVRFLSVAERMEAARIDVANTDRLRAIIAKHGWRRKRSSARKVHRRHGSSHSTPTTSSTFSARRSPCSNGPSTTATRASHLAYLTDRVRMNEGRPQLFGTQVADISLAVADRRRGTRRPATREQGP